MTTTRLPNATRDFKLSIRLNSAPEIYLPEACPTSKIDLFKVGIGYPLLSVLGIYGAYSPK
jgi:hypothetical protein